MNPWAKRTFPLLFVALVLGGCSRTPPAPTRPALGPAVDQLLSAAVEQKQVPGAVAMVALGDRVVYEGTASMNKDAIFAIASMTKPVTSVAVMQLVEAGKVNLDDAASKYAPELGKARVLEKDGRQRAPQTPISVRHLLTHTSGFGYEFMNPELLQLVKGGKLPSLRAGGDGFLRAPLLFDPGQRWEYGISIDWLGRIVEKVSGQDLEDYFRANIFEPLGMQDSFFRVPPEKQARLAKRFQRRPDGSLEGQEQPASVDPKFLSGGGGLYSTAADYLRFTQAVLGGGQVAGKRILQPETVASMGQNQIGELTITPFRSLIPEFATDNAALPGALDKFGFGFALNSKAIENGRGANTMAWAGIFNTFFWIDREKNISGVLMTQMSPGLDPGPAKLLEDCDRAVYASLP